MSRVWLAKISKLLTGIFDRGNARYKGSDCNGVISGHPKTIPLKPNRIPAWFYRGKDWSNKGEYDRAIKDYTEAIRIDPNYVNAFIGQGISWGEKGEYDRAVADFDAALRIDPDNQYAIRNRAATMSMKQIEGLGEGEGMRLPLSWSDHKPRKSVWDYYRVAPNAPMILLRLNVPPTSVCPVP